MAHGEYTKGAAITCTVEPNSGEIMEGDALVISGDRVVTLATANGQPADAIAGGDESSGPAGYGRRVNATFKGIKNVPVTGAVSVEDTLVVSSEPGVFRAADPTVDESADGGDWRVLASPGVDNLALCLIR